MDKEVETLDPETEFLFSNQKTGNEWELFKENVRPLKRGRNVRLLNTALKAQTDNHLRTSILENRRRLIEAIDEYTGEDPLQPWLEYGGFAAKVAENCADAEVIFSFLDANSIGQTHSVFYIFYALHMESKNKLKNANDVFNLGMARNAQPREKIEDAYKKFLARSVRRPTKATEEDSTENRLPVRSFGTVLARGDARRHAPENSDLARKKLKLDRAHAAPFSIYKDTNIDITFGHQPESSKIDTKSWHTLGTRAERNKENNAIHSKWTSNKIPQRPGSRTGSATASVCIEVFVDEECADLSIVNLGYDQPERLGIICMDNRCEEAWRKFASPSALWKNSFTLDILIVDIISQTTASEGGKSSTLQLRQGDSQNLKKETQLLRENPLRNFPPNSFPR
ncbi:hypothetical protein HHK36_031357 [Tetracentron sinense]|uniref:BUB1 N-terminal domain-containing protein n=1 Tax=Tetracentron sinense TaxID=13715 RepID=A0A835D2G4_TETSI|nr:hypothetical protein HHK36_031357 [Tetracentron sinense]